LQKLRSKRALTEDDLTALASIAIVISVLGIAYLYIQFTRLWKTFRTPKRRQQQEEALSSDDVRAVQSDRQSAHRQSIEALAADAQSMRDMQREVRDKLAGLQQLVAHLSEQQQDKSNATSEEGNDRLKSD
jgi:hypothetical protein